MFKKICIVLIIAVLFSVYTISVFASGNDVIKNLIKDESNVSKQQFLVTITRPDGDETICKKSYAICGSTDMEGIRVELYILDKNTGLYKEFKNTDNESSWDIGSSGVFIKEVELPRVGANNIIIVAYKKSETNNLILDTNLQINRFMITVLNENFKDKIINGILKITDMLKGL